MIKLTVSQLGRRFGLSRGALLYYHREGLLLPSGRTASGYRYYTEKDVQRLGSICHYRRAGLTLEDIQALLKAKGKPRQKVLEQRFQALSEQILELRSQQTLLLHLLKGLAAGAVPPRVDKDLWVDMLRAAGMDDRAMAHWHAEFEHRAPEGHHAFLLSLGLPETEVQRIRQWSAKAREESPSPCRAEEHGPVVPSEEVTEPG